MARSALAIALAGYLVIAAGCGDDDDYGPTTTVSREVQNFNEEVRPPRINEVDVFKLSNGMLVDCIGSFDGGFDCYWEGMYSEGER